MRKYKTIIADPPWKYKGRGPASSKKHRPNSYGAAPCSDEKYGAITMEELKQMPIKYMSEDKAHLYLWVTNAFIERGWQLCKDWGFDPKTIVTWGKLRRADGKPSMKTGYYFRGATEHFIFATKGNLRLKDKAVEPTLFLSERLPHSVKPEWFYELVNRCSFDNKLELFARRKRLGWDSWGDEIDSDITITALPMCGKHCGNAKSRFAFCLTDRCMWRPVLTDYAYTLLGFSNYRRDWITKLIIRNYGTKLLFELWKSYT